MTTIEWGTNPWQRHITTYFRTTFEVADPTTIESLDLSLLVDDGAVVHLNGTEILRDNMPVGPLAHTTPAATGRWGTAEQIFTTHLVPAAALVAGTNTLAVEVHNHSGASGDISFDLGLVGRAGGTEDLTPPSTPTGLRSGVVTDTTIELLWECGERQRRCVELPGHPGRSRGR